MSLDRVSFGGPVVKSGDPVEQEEQLKYASLVTNTVMPSNVADMARDGHSVTSGLVASTSPYGRRHILRFGQYALDIADPSGPRDPQPLLFEQAL